MLTNTIMPNILFGACIAYISYQLFRKQSTVLMPQKSGFSKQHLHRSKTYQQTKSLQYHSTTIQPGEYNIGAYLRH